jgi:EmrB/QacA subfamily drug resistance transporter
MFKTLITEENKKWWVLLALAIFIVMLNIDLTAVNLALADIALDLHASLVTLQWVINGFIISNGTFILLAGSLIAVFGKKDLFLISCISFIITSVLVALSWDSYSIVIARFIQGATLAIAFPVSSLLIFSLFNKKQYGIALGILMGGAGLGQAIGPSVGGIIVTLLGWRWIFFINVPIGLLVVILILLTGLEKIKKEKIKINVLPLIIITIGILLTLGALNEFNNWGLELSVFIFLMGIVLAFLGVFVSYKNKDPYMDLSLFKNKQYVLLSAIRWCFQFSFFSLLFILGIFLINILSFSTFQAGLIMLFASISLGVLSIFGGRLVDKCGAKKVIIIGQLFFALACFMFATFSYPYSFIRLVLPFLFFGIASGFVFSPTTTCVGLVVEEKQRNLAINIFYTTILIVSSLGVAITGTVIGFISRRNILPILSKLNLSSYKESLLIKMSEATHPIADIVNHFPSNKHYLISLVRDVFLHSFSIIMWILFAIIIISIFLLFFLKIEKPQEE